jgi:ATP-binding cassette subfamily B protein
VIPRNRFIVRIPLHEYWTLLSRYLTAQRRWLGILAAVVLAGIAVRLLGPWFAARFLDRASAEASGTGHGLAGLLVLATLFGAAGVVDQVLTVAGTHLGSYVSWRATNRLREDVVEHCLRLDAGFHADHAPGEMVERVDGDVRELSNFFAQFALNLIGNIVLVVGALIVMVFVDWRIAAVFAGFSGVAVSVFGLLHGRAAPYWLRSRQVSATLYSDVEDRFGGLPDIRANGAADYVQDRFSTALRALFLSSRTALTVSIAINSIAGLVMVLGGVAILGVAAGLYLSGALPIGTVFLMSSYTQIIAAPLRRIVAEINDLQRATASITRVRELLATTPSVVSGPGGAPPPGAPSLCFDAVEFRYPGNAGKGPALCDVSFVLEPGQLLGVLGRTGAGKSTLARLMLRLYDPTLGRIELGGVDLRQLTLAELRRNVAVVTQEVHLFGATVRDNVTMFDNQTDDPTLLELLHSVGLGDWIGHQAAGLDTVLAPNGAGLSGGEAQLLGIARVLMRDPGLVILDEPTSRLDPRTEERLQQALDRLFTDRTGVVVAHRLSTLARADMIMSVEDGRIVEYGPRIELAHDLASRYYRAISLGDNGSEPAWGSAC